MAGALHLRNGGSMYLTRDEILNRQDIHTEDVDVPEWGGMVRVRGMSGVERDKFEASLVAAPQTNGRRQRQQSPQTNMENIRAKLCAWCAVDEAGARIFQDGDIATLGEKSAAALNRVFDVAVRLSGISEDDVDEIAQKMVEDPFVETS